MFDYGMEQSLTRMNDINYMDLFTRQRQPKEPPFTNKNRYEQLETVQT